LITVINNLVVEPRRFIRIPSCRA